MLFRNLFAWFSVVSFLSLLFVGGNLLFAVDPDKETQDFLKKHTPKILKIISEAKEKEYSEILIEAEQRIEEIQEEYNEAEEEEGKESAHWVARLADNFSAMEYQMWKIEEGKISETEGEEMIGELLIEHLEFRNKMDTELIDRLIKEGEEEEAESMKEEIEWRKESSEEAARELFEELFGEGEEEDEDEDDGPSYEAPATEGSQKDEDLKGVSYEYKKHIFPTLSKYCLDCHDAETAKGDIDLESALSRRPLVRDRSLWENVAERIRNGDMPPKDKDQPHEKERLRLRKWISNEVDLFDYSQVRAPGHVPARRLSREEYNRTIRDLVGLDLRPADQFPMDFTGTSGFSNSANTLFLHTAHLDRYMSAAETVIDAAQKDKSVWDRLTDNGNVKQSLRRFVRLAFRRPPTDQEMNSYLNHYQVQKGKGKNDKEAIGTVMKVILLSPNFLLKAEELSSVGKDTKVTQYDMASRLSYFLWASAPDQNLLSLAEKDQLQNDKRIREQILRMLKDPRSESLGRIFASEWLSTDDVGPRIRKDPIDNPWCTETLMAAMREETSLFFHSLVMENEPIERLIDSNYTFLNAELAEYYRVPGIEGNKMRRVKINTRQRGGILGHASVLATTSFPHRTSPVLRGTWILTTLLGTPPPPPPPDVPEIEVGGGRRAASNLREKLEVHRDSKRCAGCHSQIDPLGFALENYSEFGRWRNGVDNRGELPNGARFRGPQGLKKALIDTRLDDLGKQLIRKMLSYALGRQLEYYDEAVVREIAQKLKGSGYPLKDMVIEIGLSYPFTIKRVPAELSNKTKP
ncbi:MAG: DUF1592 domain-containing protein [Akkermansiaceae bacterium]|nr:DUF1592 domain-containing protein [Akkermansiaceae bacterium]